MIEASRRGFLFGLGAAVAATQLRLPMAIAKEITPAPSLPRLFSRRLYTGIIMDSGYGDIPRFIRLKVSVQRGPNNFLELRLGAGNCAVCSWCAMPGDEISVKADECLRVEMEGGNPNTKAYLIYKEFPLWPMMYDWKADNEIGVLISEEHDFVGRPITRAMTVEGQKYLDYWKEWGCA